MFIKYSYTWILHFNWLKYIMHEQLWIVVNDFEEFTTTMIVLRNIKNDFYKNNLVQYEQVIVFTLKDRSTSPALFVPRRFAT